MNFQFQKLPMTKWPTPNSQPSMKARFHDGARETSSIKSASAISATITTASTGRTPGVVNTRRNDRR